ncbi:MAG: hypothetical protein SO000_07020 [Sodaliphilus sp.]|nr:hypothetical protein [Sodaliphilus sp.]
MKDYSINSNMHPTDAAVLSAAYRTWMACGSLRSSRQRCKRFAYGDQWGDPTIDVAGNRMTEWERYSRNGGSPITNNLIRQLVRTVVGRFRSQLKDEGGPKSRPLRITRRLNATDELDSRALEEFLISGCCVQRVDVESRLCDRRPRVCNVNLNRFFVNAYTDPLGRDCEILGQLHDLSLAELMRLTAGGDRRKAAWLRGIYTAEAEQRTASFTTSIGADSAVGTDFWHAAESGKCRAIEVWTLESREVLVCHDRATAQVTLRPPSAARRLRANPDVNVRWDIATVWRCRWFSPMGDLLASYDSPWAHGMHPYVVKMYPLTDGEVHSLVEDVIDQQKQVNRLVTLVDQVMAASAKGVLLFPDTALPEGFSWSDIRLIWRNCNGILPYSPNECNAKPEQIISHNTDIGALQMVQLQMRLLEEVSGVSGALQGKTGTAGNSASLYQSEVQNSTAALADVFDTFNDFRRRRNRKIEQL